MVKIKWTNKYSNEIGFVESIDKKNRHFVNTFDESEAKLFDNIDAADSAINKLIEFGEGENNIFEVFEVDIILPEKKSKKKDKKNKDTATVTETPAIEESAPPVVEEPAVNNTEAEVTDNSMT